jgi:hypothetical protein
MKHLCGMLVHRCTFEAQSSDALQRSLPYLKHADSGPPGLTGFLIQLQRMVARPVHPSISSIFQSLILLKPMSPPLKVIYMDFNQTIPHPAAIHVPMLSCPDIKGMNSVGSVSQA